MALTYTPGGATDNSYATVDDGDTYFGDRLNSTEWINASNGNKEKALVTATRRIDEEQFYGGKSTGGQALKWPQDGDSSSDAMKGMPRRSAIFCSGAWLTVES